MAFRSVLPSVVTAALIGLLAACEQAPPALDTIRQRGELRVVTINSPVSYYLGAHGAEGLEFELAEAFAAKLGVGLLMYPVPDAQTMREDLASGRADIAAAQLTADPAWERIGVGADVYERVPQHVVCRRGKNRVKKLADLERGGRLAVRDASPQERLLERLRDSRGVEVEWMATAPASVDPLDDVKAGHADCALVDAREFSFSRHLYPELAIAFSLPEERPAQWIVRRHAGDLYAAVNDFFRAIDGSGELDAILARASGDRRSFEYEESRKFQEHIASRLPPYRAWFEEAAEQNGIDWRLLAAMGYQESKWDPRAASPDGAVGVMMLVGGTARELGVRDRNDPRESIFAGARYFAGVRSKIPARVPEPDRTWMAVAAYNVGFGHLEDARVLAQARGTNPDLWTDVRAVLPLLQQEKYYSRAKRGYARGWEPVQYVEQVQGFLTMLEWQERAEEDDDDELAAIGAS
jgi:membrane-bound lytic murein transglycosylase F